MPKIIPELRDRAVAASLRRFNRRYAPFWRNCAAAAKNDLSEVFHHRRIIGQIEPSVLEALERFGVERDGNLPQVLAELLLMASRSDDGFDRIAFALEKLLKQILRAHHCAGIEKGENPVKKLLVFVLIALLALAALPALAEAAAEPDAVTSASVNDFYADGMLTGDDLMNAINAYTGFYAVASVNPDGTPNLGFYIYGCVKVEDSYYLQLGLSPNQTTANVDAGSELVAMYAALPAEGATYPTSGARMTLSKVTDEALLEELLKTAPEGFTPMYYEITSVRSLG